MRKFTFIFFALLASLTLLVVFAFIFFGIFVKFEFDVTDRDNFTLISSLFVSSFAVVIALITLLLNLGYARSRSIIDRDNSVKPLILLNRRKPDDKFYSNYNFCLTLPHSEGVKIRHFETFNCILHNYGLGVAQKLVFICRAEGKYYKSEGVTQVIDLGENTSIRFSYYMGQFESFDLFSGFQDVYGNLYFISLIESFSGNDKFYGDLEDEISVDNSVLIDDKNNYLLHKKLRQCYFGKSTHRIE